MTDDDTSKERERFSEDEMAFLRRVEFGELPPRVLPEQRTELMETEPRRDLPEPEPWIPQG